VEETPDRADPTGPEVARKPPSQPPPDSKAWRKSWRKKWRKGSTYRGCTLIQREILHYVEDNAGDDGSVIVTVGQLAEYLSSSREVISRSNIQKATAALTKKGLLLGIQQSIQGSIHTITRYVRVNYKEYQEPTPERIQLGIQQGILSSRGRQKQTEKSIQLTALVAAMRQKYRDRTGEDLDIPDRTLGDLKAVQKVTRDDAETLRRWESFLEDKFYPTKNLNRFRAAQSKYAPNKKKPPPIPVSSLPESSRALLEALDSYSGKKP
jgi:hypothetical protein